MTLYLTIILVAKLSDRLQETKVGLSQLQRASFRQIRNPSPITASNAYWKERSSGKNEKKRFSFKIDCQPVKLSRRTSSNNENIFG